jgi:phage gpG-like protein
MILASGLREFRRDLARIDKDLGKAVSQHLRGVASTVRGAAREKAETFRQSGELARSYRYSVRAKGASIYSNSPYAGVHEFGGTIRPRGTPIEIEKRAPIYGAIADKAAFVEEELGDVLEVVAGRHGFSPGASLGNPTTVR